MISARYLEHPLEKVQNYSFFCSKQSLIVFSERKVAVGISTKIEFQ